MKKTITGGILFFLLCAAAPLSARAQSEAALCRLLPNPQSGNSGAVSYVPGVDVHGNPVAPANLSASSADSGSGSVVRIPITMDLLSALSQPLPAGMEAKAPAAVVEIHSDGRVFMNGADVSENAALLCFPKAGVPAESDNKDKSEKGSEQ